jgi:hypothetical protein
MRTILIRKFLKNKEPPYIRTIMNDLHSTIDGAKEHYSTEDIKQMLNSSWRILHSAMKLFKDSFPEGRHALVLIKVQIELLEFATEQIEKDPHNKTWRKIHKFYNKKGSNKISY